MRTMTRNRRTFYYADLLGVTMSQDTDGNYVEDTMTYSDPVECKAPITAANGQAETQLFGVNEPYDKVITLNKGEDFLKIGSILWVDTSPDLDEQGKATKPYDYIVVKSAESLNFVNVAIRKVDVS